MIEFEMKVEIKIDKKKYEAVNRTQGCEGCVALSDPELCGFLSITLANETFGGLRENNSGNTEIKRLKQDNICDIFRVVFVQPEQEPVAWLLSSKTSIYTELRKTEPEGTDMYLYTVTPLYTAPQKREPLSDDEMRAIWKEGIRCEIPFVEIGRAIEKAHGIGVAEL